MANTFSVPISRSWFKTSAKSGGGGREKCILSSVCGCVNLRIQSNNLKANHIIKCEVNDRDSFIMYPRAKAWRQGLSNPDTNFKSSPWQLGEVLGRSSDMAMFLVPPYTSSPNRGIPMYFACARIYYRNCKWGIESINYKVKSF